MKNKIRFYLVVFALFFFSFGYLKKDEINYEDIRSTLKVFGIYFSKQDINTMKDYVNRNKNSYSLMREKELGNSVAPALNFNIDLKKSKGVRFSFEENTFNTKNYQNNHVSFIFGNIVVKYNVMYNIFLQIFNSLEALNRNCKSSIQIFPANQIGRAHV